ncbi:MAG: DNA polymerase I [Anaerolineae bacterium]|nr:DNA polymerase I [Anaerolineae bacterium]
MTDSRPKLVLIDGHGLAYQQYHALPVEKFATTQGEPTNAVYGFARTLLDILNMNPRVDYLAVSFDQGLSGRETVYTAYKGTRDKMPNDMIPQISRIYDLVRAFNIPILEADGYEADDVIGTAAKQAVAQGADVLIITGDRDLLQLVDEHTSVQLPGGRTQKGPQMYDLARVGEVFGVQAKQIPDYKGLAGDASDNIPGVKGIGDKTATQLLQQYGTLEEIYAHLDEQKGSKRDKLEAGRDSAFMSKQLATIITDIPLHIELEKCVAHDFDQDTVAQLFRALEFRSFLSRLPQPIAQVNAAIQAANGGSNGQQMALFDMPASAVPAEPPKPIQQLVKTIVVDTEDALADLVYVLDAVSTIAFDTETTSTDQMRGDLVGISLAINGSTGYYIPVGHVSVDGGEAPRQLPIDRVIEALRPALTDLRKQKWAHNAAYDLVMMRRYGLDVSPITFDTMIAEWLINPDSRNKGLKDQAEIRLGVEMTHIEELIGRGKNQITMDRVPIERAAPYAAADAAMTFRLVDKMRPDLEKKGNLWQLFSEIEMPLVPVIADMIMVGAKLDLDYLVELQQEFVERLKDIEEKIYELVGERFQIGSLKQLNEILFNKLGLPTTGLGKTIHGFSIDADALERLSPHHPIIDLLINWRMLEKLRNTYVEALPKLVDKEGRVHTLYNQTGAVTGRISSENPNLQNIPIRTEEGRRVRRAFIAAPGYKLLAVDYSQVELRILAHYSKDHFLTESFLYDRDIHRATAAAVYGVPFEQVTKEQRYLAKRVNFGLLYGMGAYRLARESGLPIAEAETFIKRYFERLPGVQQYLEGSKQKAYEQGYLETMRGRRRYFPGLGSGSSVPVSSVIRARAEREAINMPVQGTAADIIKIAMIQLSARLKAERPRARLILQVHDELVLEVPDDDIPGTAALVCEVMEHAVEMAVPLRVEANVGLNWAEMQPVESAA